MTDADLTPEDRVVVERLRRHGDQGQLSPELADRLRGVAPSVKSQRRASWLPAVGIAAAVALTAAIVWGANVLGSGGRTASPSVGQTSTSGLSEPDGFPISCGSKLDPAPQWLRWSATQSTLTVATGGPAVQRVDVLTVALDPDGRVVSTTPNFLGGLVTARLDPGTPQPPIDVRPLGAACTNLEPTSTRSVTAAVLIVDNRLQGYLLDPR